MVEQNEVERLQNHRQRDKGTLRQKKTEKISCLEQN